MPRIDDISFAKLVCGGKVSRTTSLVYRDKVDSRWWRKNGTMFSPEDFDNVIAANPEIVIFGLGILNKVSILPETLKRFENEGIPYEALDSKEAMDRFNNLYDSGKSVIGAFHLM